jgi:Ser/Thr protein kinase RdoA (MazF antagonist)
MAISNVTVNGDEKEIIAFDDTRKPLLFCEIWYAFNASLTTMGTQLDQ